MGCLPRTLLLRRGRSRLLLFPMDKDPDRKARVEVELLQLIMLTHSVQIEVSFVLEFSLQRRQRKPLRVEFTGSGRGL